MKRTILMLTLLFVAGGILGDEVEFTAKAPNVVRQGQQFRLTFTVNSKAENFEPPAIQHFSVLVGPSTSSSTNVSIINGKMTRQFQLSYTFILRADETGKFTIPAARIEVEGEQYETGPVTIEVIGQKQEQGSSGQPGAGSGSQERSERVQAAGDDLFVRVLVSKSSVYREEPLVATIKLYSKLSISGLENVHFPAFEGFYKQEIETPTLRQLEEENINGEIYGTGVLKKYLLFPQKSGKLTIDPFQVDCIVQKKVKSQSQSLFDDFFGSHRNVRMPVKTDPVIVRVKDLPGPQPSEFSGGVGSFDITASVNKNRVETNQGVTLTLEITGQGNLKVLGTPKINFPPDLEVYDPKITNDISISDRGAKGTKTLEYLIIPRHAGQYRIPSASISFFNLSREAYNTARTQPVTLHV
ncbi:MAG TPA: BatD family protein, partial [Bacteroidales bacterium]|nr:BatD family protein [Bacteroidales bacterium]